MVKNTIKFNEKEYTFEDLCVENVEIKYAYK
jgi:hypothetical protein